MMPRIHSMTRRICFFYALIKFRGGAGFLGHSFGVKSPSKEIEHDNKEQQERNGHWSVDREAALERRPQREVVLLKWCC